MAIIDGFPGLEVNVEVDGRTAKEYEDPDAVEEDDDDQDNDDLYNVQPGQPRPHVVKYIEAKPGLKFSFRLKRTADFKHVGDCVFFMATVDGRTDKTTRDDLAAGKHSTWRHNLNCLYSQDSSGNTKEHLFKFGTLDVGDMDGLTPIDLKKQAKQAKDFGILKVRCYHGLKRIAYRPSGSAVAAPSPIDGISEKALKGKSLDCLATFDTSSRVLQRSTESNPHLDIRRRPFAIFEFRYRSRKGLMDEGIIPRPPPGDMVGDMTDDEVRRLARQLLAEREKTNPVKKDEEKPRGIKREGGPIDDAAFARRYKTRRSNNGHIEIDLTGDD